MQVSQCVLASSLSHCRQMPSLNNCSTVDFLSLSKRMGFSQVGHSGLMSNPFMDYIIF